MKYAIPADLLTDREAAIRKAVAEQGLVNLTDIVGETTAELCDELMVVLDVRDDLFNEANSLLYDAVEDLYEQYEEEIVPQIVSESAASK